MISKLGNELVKTADTPRMPNGQTVQEYLRDNQAQVKKLVKLLDESYGKYPRAKKIGLGLAVAGGLGGLGYLGHGLWNNKFDPGNIE